MNTLTLEFKAPSDTTLIENGYEPVVILPGEKRPAAEGWQKGAITAKRLTTERDEFGSDTGTGLRTGRLVGIDIDVVNPEHAKQVRDLAEKMLGSTPLVRVGKKGFLLCYRNETPIKKQTLSAGNAKIEILGSGQQFVAFGIHPDTGKPYQWIVEDPDVAGAPDNPGDVPLDNLPEVTPDKLQAFLAAAGEKMTKLGYPVKASTILDGAPSKHAGRPISAKALREILSYIDPNEERDEWRNDVASIRAANVPDDIDLAKLACEWSRGELDRHRRYKDKLPSRYTGDADVMQVFDTMLPKEGGIGVGTLIAKSKANGWKGNPFDDGRTLEERFASYRGQRAIKDNSIGAEASAKDTNGPRIKLLSPAEILALPDPTPLVEGFIIQHENVINYGEPKIGKTFAMLDLALSIAANRPVFGKLKVHKPGPVVYLTGEGQFGFKQRLRAWQEITGIDVNVLPFHFFPDVPHSAYNSEQEARDYIEGIRAVLPKDVEPALVVIDTLANAIEGQDENSSAALGAYWAMVRNIRLALHTTTLTIAHVGKDKTKGVRGWSGSIGTVDRVQITQGDSDRQVLKIVQENAKDTPQYQPQFLRLTACGESAVVKSISGTEYDSKGKSASADKWKSLRQKIVKVLTDNKLYSPDQRLLGYGRSIEGAGRAIYASPAKRRSEISRKQAGLRQSFGPVQKGFAGRQARIQAEEGW